MPLPAGERARARPRSRSRSRFRCSCPESCGVPANPRPTGQVTMSRNILAAAIVMGALAAVASAGAGERARCSIMPFVGVRPSQTTVLLGTASPDTVEAGPGSVTPSGHGGHFGRGGAGAIYGQVVDVARFGGTDSLALARAFALLQRTPRSAASSGRSSRNGHGADVSRRFARHRRSSRSATMAYCVSSRRSGSRMAVL